jgi:2-keto-4-pentenoate hydratase/2-oxohepta-3-ene-1,7-dioic acid hydratase in catechol pathway
MKTARLTGSEFSYPIGKIVCIGRNYADHIKELGNEMPERPILFMKPASCVIGEGDQIVIPPYSSDCHHEAELALLIGTGGSAIPVGEALNHIAGFGVAIDLTLRDVQTEQKKKGLPWEIAKGFDTACPLSAFIPAASVSDPQDLRITLTVNGEPRQDGSTALMIHRLPELISYISAIFTLEPGDLILTGTPAGVGPIRSGDLVVAEIAQVGKLSVTVR